MKVDDQSLLEGLTEAFRIYGYEGASLSRISEITGLQRASLYHRFPDGKQQMVEAVLDHTDEHFAKHVLAPLRDGGDPVEKIKAMTKRLKAFYAGGRRSCLLDTLSLGEATNTHEHVKRSFKALQAALARVARELGAATGEANQLAEEALMRIEGALVLARATDNVKPFERVLKGLPEFLGGR